MPSATPQRITLPGHQEMRMKPPRNVPAMLPTVDSA